MECNQLELWLHFNGKHGRAPVWWWVLDDAKRLNAPPWVLNREPQPCVRFWSNAARAADWAQYHADHWPTEGPSA